MGEIEEESPTNTDESTPLLSTDPIASTRKVPVAEVRLYRLGKGPIEVFKANLGGWDQDQLEVREILDKYGLKSVHAFNPGSARGAPIRFNPKNGRSLLSYKDGSVIHLDGQSQDSLVKPITKILSGVALLTLMIVYIIREAPPNWASKLNLSGGRIPPWILGCVVIVFTRFRKRTQNYLQNRWK